MNISQPCCEEIVLLRPLPISCCPLFVSGEVPGVLLFRHPLLSVTFGIEFMDPYLSSFVSVLFCGSFFLFCSVSPRQLARIQNMPASRISPELRSQQISI